MNERTNETPTSTCIITEVGRHSFDTISPTMFEIINYKYAHENYTCEITSTSYRGQWVNALISIYVSFSKFMARVNLHRADSRLAPSQWETSLQSNFICYITCIGWCLEYSVSCLLTHLPWTKWMPFRRHFQMHFFMKEKYWILFQISLKFVPKDPVDNKVTRTDPRPALRPAEGPNSFHWKNVKLEVLSCCTKFHEPHVVSEYVHFKKNIVATKALPIDTLIINI